MSWLRRKRDARLEKQVGKVLKQLPPMQMTPGARLFGAYMPVKDALTDGINPSEVTVDPVHNAGEGVSAEAYFRAVLRATFGTDDELAAFDEFARGHMQLVRRMRSINDDDQERGLLMVRDYLVRRVPPPRLPPPPP